MKYVLLAIPVFLNLSCSGIDGPDIRQESETKDITVDLRNCSSRFDGLGSILSYGKLLYDYPEKQRNEILDYLFLPNYGANLQILKVELGYDGNNTTIAWPAYRRTLQEEADLDRGYAVWFMKEAKKRNRDIRLSILHWGYPAWAESDELKADFVTDYVTELYKKKNLHIDYVGGNQNESAITPDVTKLIRQKLDANGMKDVKIICADEGARVEEFNVINHLENDPGYANAVDVIGVHYKSRPASFMPEKIYSFGKPVWSSEDGGGNYLNIGSGRQWVKQLFKLLYDVRLNGVLRWVTTASIYDNMSWPNNGIMKTKEPWSGHYVIGTNLWAFAHFTQFIKPGWHLLDNGESYLTDDHSEGRYLIFADMESHDYSIVFDTYDMNFKGEEVNVRIIPEGPLKSKSLNLWSSHFENPDETFSYSGTYFPEDDGSIILSLNKNRIYTASTTSGQAKGNAKSPAPKSFKLPYTDNFDATETGAMAKYFVNVSGAFEIVDDSGNNGKCLQQMVREQPVLWHPGSKHIAQPLAEIGSMEWSDYSVSIDIKFIDSGAVALGARIDPFNTNDEQYGAEGYWLTLTDSGIWHFGYKTEDEFETGATGQFLPGKNNWINLSIKVKGNQVTACINGNQVAACIDTRHMKGNIAIGTLPPDNRNFRQSSKKSTRALFDNLEIIPI